MALRFKPMPGLTLITAICVIILMSLGTWQYQRLQWKTALLAEVEAAINAPPLRSLRELESEIDAGNPVDFRRIELTATMTGSDLPYLVYQPRQDGIYWRAYAPLLESDINIYGAFGVVRDDKKEVYDISYLPSGVVNLAGHIRKTYPMGRIESWVKSSANPKSNRYFKFNQTGDWDIGGVIETDIYLDLSEDFDDASLLPIKRPEIRNNHFDYMLTWYSFAIILLIIYAIMHYRNGRLSWS